MPETKIPRVFLVIGPDIWEGLNYTPEQVQKGFENTGLKKEDLCIVDLSKFLGGKRKVKEELEKRFKEFAEKPAGEHITVILAQHGSNDSLGNLTSSVVNILLKNICLNPLKFLEIRALT